jgi:hypothetical protein
MRDLKMARRRYRAALRRFRTAGEVTLEPMAADIGRGRRTGPGLLISENIPAHCGDGYESGRTQGKEKGYST